MRLGREVGFDPSDIVLDGNPAPPSQKGAELPPPKKSAHVYCGQTARWIKMAHGMKVGFGAGHIVLDGDPAGWLDQDATWYGGGPRSTPHC